MQFSIDPAGRMQTIKAAHHTMANQIHHGLCHRWRFAPGLMSINTFLYQHLGYLLSLLDCSHACAWFRFHTTYFVRTFYRHDAHAVKSPDEISVLNRKQRTRMATVKEGQK